MSSSRIAALEILQRIDRDGGFSNILLDRTLSRFALSAADAALVTALVYGVTEKRITIDYFIEIFAKRRTGRIHPEILNILRLGMFQILFMDRIPDSAAVNESVNLVQHVGKSYAKGFVNRVLRETCRHAGSLPYPDREEDYLRWLEVKYSCPSELITSFQKDYGLQAAEGILMSLGGKRPHTAKVNTLLTNPDSLLDALERENTAARRSEVFDDMIEFDAFPGLKNSPAFIGGLFHMQGYSSRLCCGALGAAPGDKVLDLCAAPGGKTFTVAEMMQNKGKIIACDIYSNRLQLISSGAKRLKLGCIDVLRNNAAEHNAKLGAAQRVLCDVPCSGLGVMASKPEIRYKDPAGFKALPELQYKILCEGASHVETGGTLVYSTCTLRKAENDDVAGRFLEEHEGFETMPVPGGFASEGTRYLTLFPHIHHTDGFFIACFRKKE